MCDLSQSTNFYSLSQTCLGVMDVFPDETKSPVTKEAAKLSHAIVWGVSQKWISKAMGWNDEW